jgi:hypothetical protein
MDSKLLKIQSELKAPKGQYNSFGKYSYRNCEDILEAVKPLLLKYNSCLTLSDEIIEVGGRIYVKSTASIIDNEKGSNCCIKVSAFAREAEIQKGMNESQITGSASSYSRKYALNALFLIDDTKDDDFNNTVKKEEPKQKGDFKNAMSAIEKAGTKEELTKINNLIPSREWTEKEVTDLSKAIEQKEGSL